jgi:hypothetical protein
MTANRRYPISYTILAGLAGAIAWGLPYPISPFLHLIPFMPDFPVYESPPFQVPLAELTFSYALSGLIAGGLFLFGIRFLSINRERYTRPSLSRAIVLSSMAGLAIGGALAILVGLLISSSHTGFMVAAFLGLGSGSIEPFLTVGWILGTALAAIIFGLFSGIMKPTAPVKDSPIQLTLRIVVRVSSITLLIRLIAYLVEFSSFFIYTIGDSILVFIFFQAASGVFFGILTWIFCSKLIAAPHLQSDSGSAAREQVRSARIEQ